MTEREGVIHQDEVLHTLSDREARVLKLRFGLGGNKQMTLEEVGKVFGISRQRIQQIEAKAFEEIGEELEIDADKVREIFKIAQEATSLETPVGGNKESFLGDLIPGESQSKVIRTLRRVEKGIPVVHRERKRPDGTKFKTTEWINSPKNAWVVNSKGETKLFDPDKFRNDVKLCYGKLHIYEEDLNSICNDVAWATDSSYKQIGRKKTVGTELIEESILLAMDKAQIPKVIRLRYITRFCIDSIPKDELRDIISSAFKLNNPHPENS